MKASELIEKMAAAISEHGDLEVLVRYPEDGSCWDDMEVVPDPPTPMEKDSGESGTIDINAVGDGIALPELTRYEDCGDGPKFEIDEDHNLDTLDDGCVGTYEVIFEVLGERHYCTVTATNMAAALGLFFREHPHLTYDMIVDHMEV